MTTKAIWWQGYLSQPPLIGSMKLGYLSCSSLRKKYRDLWVLKATPTKLFYFRDSD
jgi:gluconate kinase